MQAGTLNRRATILKPKTGGSWGQQSGWEEHTKVWCNVLVKSGSETIKADAVTSKVRASIRIRFRTDINHGMRLVVSGQTFNIMAVQPDIAGREFCDLVCEVINA